MKTDVLYFCKLQLHLFVFPEDPRTTCSIPRPVPPFLAGHSLLVYIAPHQEVHVTIIYITYYKGALPGSCTPSNASLHELLLPGFQVENRVLIMYLDKIMNDVQDV